MGEEEAPSGFVTLVDQCRNKEDVREVTIAAEEPKPVLCTSFKFTFRGANGIGCSSF